MKPVAIPIALNSLSSYSLILNTKEEVDGGLLISIWEKLAIIG
jgi:hypothetical protein